MKYNLTWIDGLVLVLIGVAIVLMLGWVITWLATVGTPRCVRCRDEMATDENGDYICPTCHGRQPGVVKE